MSQIVEETAELYSTEGRPLPQPLAGKEFVNAMQRIA
jgi:hypothetical protein